MIRHRRQNRLTLGLFATIAILSVIAPSGFAKAKPVVPDFGVSTVTKSAKKGKRKAIRIVAIRVTAPGISNLKVRVKCRNARAGCWRLKKGKVSRKRTGDTITWSNVNWVLLKKSAFVVTAQRKGYLGRRKVVGPKKSGSRELVFKDVACIDRRGDLTKCPGASVDSKDDTVAQETPQSTPGGPTPTVPTTRVITVDNRVTNGMSMREDSTPVRLTTQAWIYCGTRGCNINGTERSSGGTYESAVCQTNGERTTNGNDGSAVDDANPERFESSRYYGVRLANGTFGYVSEVWIRASDRGGLGLPNC